MKPIALLVAALLCGCTSPTGIRPLQSSPAGIGKFFGIYSAYICGYDCPDSACHFVRVGFQWKSIQMQVNGEPIRARMLDWGVYRNGDGETEWDVHWVTWKSRIDGRDQEFKASFVGPGDPDWWGAYLDKYPEEWCHGDGELRREGSRPVTPIIPKRPQLR